MRRGFLTTIFVAAVLLLASDAALGCVCVVPEKPPSREEEKAALVKDFDGAFAVFSGEVVEQDTFKVKFKVDKLWKGDFGDEITMSTGVKDYGNGTIGATSCDYGFKRGTKYLVFAYLNEDGEMQARECTRTKILNEQSLKYAKREMKDLDDIRLHEKRNRKADGS